MPGFGPTGGTGPAGAYTPQDGLALLYDQDLQLQYFQQHLRLATPDQIRTFIANNVTDLANAQSLLTMLTLWVAQRNNR